MSRVGGFETTVVVRRPLAEVATYLSDLENDPHWRREWVGAEPLSTGPVGAGTTTALLGEVWGRSMQAVYEVAGFEPLRFVEWRTVSGPLPLTFRRDFEEDRAGTRVTFRYDARPSRILRLVEPLVIWMGRRQLVGDLPALLAMLEGEPDPSPGPGTRRTRRVELSTWIDRPVPDVFAYVTDLDTWREWRHDVVDGRLLTEGDLRVGSRAQGLARLGRRTVTVDVVVTVLDPGSAFGYRPVTGLLRTDNLYTFESRDGGTLVTLTDDIGLRGVAQVLLPLMPGLVRSAYRRNLAGLKAVLEAQTPRPAVE